MTMALTASAIIEEIESDDDMPFAPAPPSWYHDEKSQHPEQKGGEQHAVMTADAGDARQLVPPTTRVYASQSQSPPQSQQLPLDSMAAPFASPSWKEISAHVLPSAARELLTSSVYRLCYSARWTYAQGRWSRKYRDMESHTSGYDASTLQLPEHYLHHSLPPVSSLPWIDRQLVREWRTTTSWHNDDDDDDDDVGDNNRHHDDTDDFARARTLVPAPSCRPVWRKTEACQRCRKVFGPTRLRHHCRLCGMSCCQQHSSESHKLPHLGYDPMVPERVCDHCKGVLMEQALAERIAWRLARCRDYEARQLTPYFETGVDSLEKIALRITNAAIAMAKSVPLGAQATVAVETVDVLRKYGLNGMYTIMLRQEFLAAADLLRKALGINRTAWPLSVHELSAAIFYALAQYRALRGMHPDHEQMIHRFRTRDNNASVETRPKTNEEDAGYGSTMSSPTPETADEEQSTVQPVCDPVTDKMLSSLIFYAPMALSFIYSEKEVDMQLLAAQQGWRLLYAYLEQEGGNKKNSDRPASALFVHEEQKIACVAIRGTATIHDMVTDIRQTPLPFPEHDPDAQKSENDWTTVFRGQGLAVCGMACAAVNLYHEHIDSLLTLAQHGYRIRTTGHSLGGGVATLMGVLVRRDLQRIPKCARQLGDVRASFDEEEALLRVYAYGTPSCVDAKLANFVESFVMSVVHHDDVIPRLTPASCRGLLKHLLHIRETWVKDHFANDLMAITERAKTAWAPRWREGFTLPTASPTSIKRYCRKQYQKGKKTLLSVKEKIAAEIATNLGDEQSVSSRFSSQAPSNDEGDQVSVASGDAVEESELSDPAGEPRLLIDYMGGMDLNTEGVVVDGDEFFDAGDDLIESDSEEGQHISDVFSDPLFSSACHERVCGVLPVQDDIPDGLTPNEGDELDLAGDDGPAAVVLDEFPLPKMFIPGQIVHVYSRRGTYRAAIVPRAFRELRRISMAGNMLTDHKCKAYFEALVEVRAVRVATENPPRWTAFDEDDTCSCCASRFTWASTSNTEAQEARDKHNCRSCGTLVCDPCSQNRVPLPSIGLNGPARVCDRCYNDIDGLFTHPQEAMVGNDVQVDEIDESDKPIRQRDRRSAVVDELVSRVQSSTLTCS